MDGLALDVTLSVRIDKIMLDQDPLHCFFETKDCRVAKPENWVRKVNSRTGLVVTLKEMSEMIKKPLQNHAKFLEEPEEHLNFAVNVWCSIVEGIFLNIKNQFAIATVPRRWGKNPIITHIQSAICSNYLVHF